MVIIGITGNARCGKDTVTDMLITLLDSEELVVERIALADELKRIVVDKLGMRDVMELNEHKNTGLPYKGFNIRECLTYTGDGIKEIDNDYFSKIVSKHIQNSEADYVIITDVRMVDELKYLRDNHKLYLIKVTNERVTVDETHRSESEVKLLEEDILLTNDGTLEELYEQVIKVTCKLL